MLSAPTEEELRAQVAAVSQIAPVSTLLEVVSELTGLRFVAVTRITGQRWIAGAVLDRIGFGLEPGGELEVETTLCHEVHTSAQPIFIDSVADSETYCDHHTPAKYGFQSYASVPIYVGDREFFGTLCAIDPESHSVERPDVRGLFTLMAELVGKHLDVHLELHEARANLSSEREIAKAREQFIAILGHDLRSPLAAFSYGLEALAMGPPQAKRESVLKGMRRSVRRMNRLIGNTLDFARGRLGDGIPIEPVARDDIGTTIEGVIDETARGWPERTIESSVAVDGSVICDAPRLGQVVANLLSNALDHGAQDRPVTVDAAIDGGELCIAVFNEGPPIPPEQRPRLFQPFKREASSGGKGLGLGLYIASEIVRAHRGSLELEVHDNGNTFRVRIPRERVITAD